MTHFRLCLLETQVDTFQLEEDDFEKVIEKFKMKPTKTYDFLIKAGTDYQKAIFRLCKDMIEKEEFPKSFRKTTLHMIWKRKGSNECFK